MSVRNCSALMTADAPGPTTVGQILWSSRVYRQDFPDFVSAWAAVNTEDFRMKALYDCDDATAECLRDFLGAFGTHAGTEVRDGLQRALSKPDFSARDLRHERLDNADMTALWPTIEKSFNQLMAVHGVAGTIASKVLAVLNSDFFVMRDRPIFLAYSQQGATPGGTYANYLLRMQGLARAIVLDALENHGVADPAGHVCEKLNLQDRDRCTLAKFIDEYNWLTITRKVVYPGAATV